MFQKKKQICQQLVQISSIHVYLEEQEVAISLLHHPVNEILTEGIYRLCRGFRSNSPRFRFKYFQLPYGKFSQTLKQLGSVGHVN